MIKFTIFFVAMFMASAFRLDPGTEPEPELGPEPQPKLDPEPVEPEPNQYKGYVEAHHKYYISYL